MAIELRREDFISQYPPLSVLNKQEVNDLWDAEEVHLYVHIPYCVKKCGFCYYKSFSTGNGEIPDEYLQLLKGEMEIYAGMPEMQRKKIKSLYLGGGTPTLLSERQMEDLVLFIKSQFVFAEDYEFCSEGRPGSELTLEKLKLLKELGMKRLSMGCQSLDDAVLTANGRNHSAQEFYRSFEMARTADIESINVDLMSGMVDQSMESWMDTIKTICKLKPENVAVYKLEVFLNNALYRKYRNGSISLISDAEEIEYARAGYRELLDHGYIFADNFSFMTDAKYDHIHRREVWNGADMLGIGLSSHSCFEDYVYQNTIDLETYKNSVQQKVLPIQRAHKISKREDMIQRAVFGLKNLHFPRFPFKEEFGVDIMDVFPAEIQHMAESGFMNIFPDHIQLTFEGALFADDIVRELYLPEHKNLMLAHIRR